MTATDELRKLLDERGIVWMDVRRPTFLRTCWKTGDADVYCYFDEEKSTGVIELTISGYDFTPEQAVAATLGTPISADLRTALDFMRIWITEDAHLGESAISYEFEKAEGLRKLGAIESAIAATLGRGTCENIAPRYLDFLCSECGFVHYIDDVNCTGDGNEWKYCPKCGCEVER